MIHLVYPELASKKSERQQKPVKRKKEKSFTFHVGRGKKTRITSRDKDAGIQSTATRESTTDEGKCLQHRRPVREKKILEENESRMQQDKKPNNVNSSCEEINGLTKKGGVGGKGRR